jgi:hypothetical protein
MNFHCNWMNIIRVKQYPGVKSDVKIFFFNDGIGKKLVTFWISAYLVENCGFQGKNRAWVITQNTLGWGLIKNYFLEN